MTNFSTAPTSQNKVRGPTARTLARQLAALGRRWFASSDWEAGWHGWRVIQLRGGLGRRYVDTSFSTLSRCPLCDGDGVRGGQVCGPCSGTGRVSWASSSDLPDRNLEGQER